MYVYIPCVMKCSGKEVAVMKKSWMRFCIYITSLCTYLRCKKIKIFTYPPPCYIHKNDINIPLCRIIQNAS